MLLVQTVVAASVYCAYAPTFFASVGTGGAGARRAVEVLGTLWSLLLRDCGGGIAEPLDEEVVLTSLQEELKYHGKHMVVCSVIRLLRA